MKKKKTYKFISETKKSTYYQIMVGFSIINECPDVIRVIGF